MACTTIVTAGLESAARFEKSLTRTPHFFSDTSLSIVTSPGRKYSQTDPRRNFSTFWGNQFKLNLRSSAKNIGKELDSSQRRRRGATTARVGLWRDSGGDGEIFDLQKFEEERQALDAAAREEMKQRASVELSELAGQTSVEVGAEKQEGQGGEEEVVNRYREEEVKDEGGANEDGEGKEEAGRAITPGAWKWDIRMKIWNLLEEKDLALPPRPVHHRIPSFKRSIEAANLLAGLPEFESARVVKVNPDSPQKQVRFLTLREGKTLLTPQPRLRTGFFSVLDASLIPESSPPSPASTLFKICTPAGIAKFGRPMEFLEKIKVDVVVVGSVAVDPVTGARLGKGEGFAELEYGILRWMGAIDENTPIITTVHDEQLVNGIPTEKLLSHDVPVDIICTPTQIIRIQNSPIPKPQGIYWELLSRQKLSSIKVLRELKKHIERETGEKLPTGPSEKLPPTAARTENKSTPKAPVAQSKGRKSMADSSNLVFVWDVPGKATWEELSKHIANVAGVKARYVRMLSTGGEVKQMARVSIPENADMAAVVASINGSILRFQRLKCARDNRAEKKSQKSASPEISNITSGEGVQSIAGKADVDTEADSGGKESQCEGLIEQQEDLRTAENNGVVDKIDGAAESATSEAAQASSSEGEGSSSEGEGLSSEGEGLSSEGEGSSREGEISSSKRKRSAWKKSRSQTSPDRPAIFFAKRMYVRSLHKLISAEELKVHVESVANVSVQQVNLLFKNGMFSRSARVALEDDADVEAAVSALLESSLKGKPIKCQVDQSEYSRSKPQPTNAVDVEVLKVANTTEEALS